MNRRARRLLIVLPALGFIITLLVAGVSWKRLAEPPAEAPMVSFLPATKSLTSVRLKGLVRSACEVAVELAVGDGRCEDDSATARATFEARAGIGNWLPPRKRRPRARSGGA